jgi:hypothetical protein
MASVYDVLYSWAKRTTSSFAELRFVSSERDEMIDSGDGLIYRLKHWPELGAEHRTADVFRALSVMSNRPVNRSWILKHSKLKLAQVDELLQHLVGLDAVEVIDGSKYGPEPT